MGTKCQIQEDFYTLVTSVPTQKALCRDFFHKVRFGLRKTFFICFEVVSSSKNMWDLQMSIRYEINENTVRLLVVLQKIL